MKDVTADGPAAQAGIRLGDVITSIGGHEVADPDDLRFRIAILPMDAPTPVQLWRDGQAVTVSVALTAPPETPARQVTALAGDTPLAGATVANLNPAQADELGLATTLRGVAVTDRQERQPRRSSGAAAGRHHRHRQSRSDRVGQ